MRWEKATERDVRGVDLVHGLVHVEQIEVNVHDAKTHLSKLLERVAQGEEVVIAKAGKPVARLVAIRPNPTGRRIGTAKGAFVVPDNFNDPWPEFERRLSRKRPPW